MEPRAVRVIQALKSRAGRSALVCAVVLIGCSSAAILYQSKPAPQKDTPPPPVTSTASPRAVSTAQIAPIALEDFTPLLAEPPFSGVAAALADEEPERAALALEKVLRERPSLRTPTTEFWLGQLWERAGHPTRALDACERAAKSDFMLAEYAELCAARALTALGRPREAFERLRGRAFLSPGENERRLLFGRAARAASEREHAIEALRAALDPGLPRADTARVRLEIAELLLEGTPNEQDVIDALGLVRRAGGVLMGIKEERERVERLEARAASLLLPAARAKYSTPTPEERLERVATLLDGRQHELTARAATELLSSLSKAEEFGKVGCSAQLLRAKALAAKREFSAAIESLEGARANCKGDAGARIWFLSGRYAVSEGRYAQASDHFSELEKRFPTHSLADDGRYYAAIAQQELGAESRFTELMLSLPNDYPNGDMTAEGVYRLALRRMELGAWSDALVLLERSLEHVVEGDRGLDLAGRERYFRARALLALGEKAAALTELETVIGSYPLGYYMLEAYSLLERVEPGRGDVVLEQARRRAEAEPFRIAGQSELETPGFARMMELLRIGELDLAVRELDALGLRGKGTGSEILWGVALLYERAGFVKFSADLASRQMNEVVRRWPVGGWERAWQIAFPRPHFDIVTREAKAENVDLALVYAIMREESGFDPKVVSPANAYGLMQLIEPTARLMAKTSSLPTSPQALKRPRVNVALGCKMLSHLATSFEQNPLLVIPAYNAGPNRARRWVNERPTTDFDLWVELIPYRETRRYTKRVLSSRAVYAYLYEPGRERSRILLPLAANAASPSQAASN